MVNFFDKLYSSIVSKNAFLDKIRFYSVLRVIVRTTANIVLPIYFKLTAGNSDYMLIPTDKKEGRLIVSLTSFPTRINKLWMVIETILRQTKKPDMIILWLSEEQFPKLESLPKNLLKLQSRGLKIELRPNDLRSHKKYYYTLTEYPNDIMITVDDDIIYRNDALKTMIWYMKSYPQCVISNYSHKMKWNDDCLMSYVEWQGNISKEYIEDDLFFGSGGGTLFPIGSLSKEVLNDKISMKICEKADDVWLNAMCRINKTRIVKTNYYSVILPVLSKKNETLCLTNLQGGNDKQIQAIRAYLIQKFGQDPFARLN